MLQQPAFDALVKTAIMPRKPTDAACRRHAMTGNHQRIPIRTAGLTDSTRRGTNAARHLGIGQYFAARYSIDNFPYLALMLGTNLGRSRSNAWSGFFR
jgi:hypothetical protein